MNSQIKDSNEPEYHVGYTPLSGCMYAGFIRCETGRCEAEPQDVVVISERGTMEADNA
ncbi:hypothetical protein DAPPPG734_18400 [Pantoea agglomerans]|uniref:Uncharacterized protein n=1 Tax=Enterobacter agglomerans TaxID=549 RepID=A0AAN2K7C6_ENTAG|nr:hypothetical protein DAPPPG734_18400 [Pantoea agglomerans]